MNSSYPTEIKAIPVTITIADAYSTYAYTFQIREDLSIAEIARGIAERFQTTAPKGTLIASTPQKEEP
jgi:hypothetical protein